MCIFISVHNLFEKGWRLGNHMFFKSNISILDLRPSVPSNPYSLQLKLDISCFKPLFIVLKS